MTRTLGNGTVEVELGDGTCTARWPEVGITLGPCAAHVDLADRRLDSHGGPGAWTVDATAAGGRARWTQRDDGPWIEVTVPAEGVVLTFAAGYTARGDEQLGGLTVVEGTIEPEPAQRLVSGYDSWSYAGVRGASEAGQSFWSTAYVGDRGAIAFQALGAERFCTCIGNDGPHVLVECGASPTIRHVAGTWGAAVLEPTAMALPLATGEEVRAEPIAIAADADSLGLIEDLAALAGEAMGVRRWNGPPITGWESWYHYGLRIRHEQLLANARVLRERYRDRPGFDVVQLDDGWQVAYGAWRTRDRFPDDLSELTAELRGLGARPGLWLAPFMVQPGVPGLGTDHEDWSIGDPGGGPLLDRHGRWGLDASDPAVVAWMRDLGAQVRAWGFDMVKLDFLYLGAQEGVRHDCRVTGTQALRDGLRAFVAGLGDGVYVLGCGAPVLPMVGLCHGNRVGHDLAMPVLLREFGQPLAEGWTGFAGIRGQARNVAARFALPRRWFDADPDVVMAWGSNATSPDGYSIEESRTLATLAAFCGGPFLLADDLAALTDAERTVLEHPGLLDLAWGDGFRPLDLFDHPDDPEVEHAFAQPRDLASLWVADRGSRRVAALFNWTDEPASRAVPTELRGAHELWTDTAVDADAIEVPPHAVRVLRS